MRHLLTYYITEFRNWVGGIPAAQRFARQHPKLAGFISDRFDPANFLGLPLLLILLAGLVNILLLSELAESVMDAEWIVIADQKFTDLLYSMRSKWLSVLLFAVTKLGEREAVFILGGLLTLYLLYHKRWWTIVAFWLVMGGVGLTVQTAKSFISRARPADVAYYEVEHFSFPSGHATTIMALAGFLAYLLYRNTQSSLHRKLIVWVAAILILLVGFSRIYLGVHFLSDVLAGFILGLLWLLVGISLEETVLYRKKKRQV
ncbi:phosphatase PAP2 family protein [Pontibacter sp. H259]|uniref:phosphatase PAP2 family protein n=1 Tax=Pontibacter sp. H259 TaxID=3133421 RepID=UPI0030BC01AA